LLNDQRFYALDFHRRQDSCQSRGWPWRPVLGSGLIQYREPERLNAVVHACLGLAAVLAVVNLCVCVTLGQVTEESPRIAQALFVTSSKKDQ
jgi:hypothetical protein